MRYCVLDWHQEANERARTFLAASDAENLVQRLAAEKIRKGVIRMFAPDSVFYALRPVAPQQRFIPAKLPPIESRDCYFVPPETAEVPSWAGVREGWDWKPESLPAAITMYPQDWA